MKCANGVMETKSRRVRQFGLHLHSQSKSQRKLNHNLREKRKVDATYHARGCPTHFSIHCSAREFELTGSLCSNRKEYAADAVAADLTGTALALVCVARGGPARISLSTLMDSSQ
jgi:hypothetical protein